MREIKFRAWDEKENRFITWTDDLLVSCSGKIFEVDYDYVEEGTPFECSCFEIEQFTGLHDKNGKEIYEGDKFCIGGIIMFVSWHEDRACFILTTGCDYGTINYITLDSDVVYQKEIIGNIHENPELLEGRERKKVGVVYDGGRYGSNMYNLNLKELFEGRE